MIKCVKCLDLIISAITALALVAGGCVQETESPLEKAGEAVEEAGEEIQDTAEEMRQQNEHNSETGQQ